MIIINSDNLEKPLPELHYKKARAYICGEENNGVSIVVQAYGRLEKTRNCVKSILEYTRGEYDLVLMDNGTADNELIDFFESVERRKKQIIRITKNITGVYAINNVLRRLNTKYIAVVNNDIIVTEGWLDNLLTCAESDDNIGMICPASTNVSNYQQENLGGFNNSEEMQMKAALFNKSNPAKWEEKIRLIPTAALYRREVFDTVGLYDAGFMHDFGDDDFTFRVRRAGYKLILCRDTFVHHDHNQEALPPERLAISQRSREFFREKYFGVDAWEDTGNYINFTFENIDITNKNGKSILAVDVKCGTPVLEMKNYCRSYGADVLYSKVYTSDIKYYADNISIADEVICGNPETLISSENNKFDFIIVGRPLNSYNNPFGFLKNLISKLSGSGYIIFCVRNANDARSFLSMLNVNIGSQPTYLVSLKDNAGLVKKFAFVNVEKYQQVAIGDTLNEAYSAYVKQLASGQIIDAGDLSEVTGRVLQVDSAVKDGNTYFYVQISGSDKVFMASIQLDDVLAVLKPEDRVTINYVDSDDTFVMMNQIEKK